MRVRYRFGKEFTGMGRNPLSTTRVCQHKKNCQKSQEHSDLVVFSLNAAFRLISRSGTLFSRSDGGDTLVLPAYTGPGFWVPPFPAPLFPGIGLLPRFDRASDMLFSPLGAPATETSPRGVRSGVKQKMFFLFEKL